MPKNMFEKIWEQHEVSEGLIYIAERPSLVLPEASPQFAGIVSGAMESTKPKC